MIARHLIVTGRVQGVFFRGWTEEQAKSLGVAGWVRNCPDGSVEAHLEGGDAALDALVERMRSGPPGARVTDISVAEVSAHHLGGFEIRH